jgi:hypothetical protein
VNSPEAITEEIALLDCLFIDSALFLSVGPVGRISESAFKPDSSAQDAVNFIKYPLGN